MQALGLKHSLACALLWMMFAVPGIAQTVPDYDPSYVPSQFRLMDYPKCGFRTASDPSWPRTHKSFVDGNGQNADKYQHELGVDFWKQDKRLGSRFSVNPIVRITIRCNDSKLRKTFFDGMVQDLYASAKKKRGERWGKLSRFEAPGIGQVSYYVGSRTSRRTTGLTDVAHVYFQRNGRNVSLMIQIGRTAVKKSSGRRLKAGKVVTLKDPDGSTYRFRLNRAAKQGPLGDIKYVRTEAENRAFIETILKSIKPL